MMTCVAFQEERFCKRSEEGDCLEDMAVREVYFLNMESERMSIRRVMVL